MMGVARQGRRERSEPEATGATEDAGSRRPARHGGMAVHPGRDSHTFARSQAYTTPGAGSHERAPAAPGSWAIERHSEAIATQSSVSASTAGLHAMGSRSTAKPSSVP